MANCSDNAYVIKYTDKSKGTITITKSAMVTNLLAIALVGKSRVDYGELFNENLLHLLENFSCPPSTGNPHSPGTAYGDILQSPIQGQKWHNSTTGQFYVFDGDVWIPQADITHLAANSGIIAHDSYLPLPVSNGGTVPYTFTYGECSFTVSPHSTVDVELTNNPNGYRPNDVEVDYMKCFVDPDGKVTMQLRYRGESALRNGYANYMIVGIKGNVNEGNAGGGILPPAVPAPTPGVSPTQTPTQTPTPTPAPSLTPSSSVAAGPTVTPTSTVTPTPTPTITLTRSVTPTPTPSTSMTASPSPTPTPSVTPSSMALVGLTDAFIEASHPSNLESASVGFILSATGNFTTESTSSGAETFPGQWLTNGDVSNYQVRVTATGDALSEGTLNTWLSLSTTREYRLEQSGQGQKEAYASVQIRRVSDGVVLATGEMVMQVVIGTVI